MKLQIGSSLASVLESPIYQPCQRYKFEKKTSLINVAATEWSAKWQFLHYNESLDVQYSVLSHARLCNGNKIKENEERMS